MTPEQALATIGAFINGGDEMGDVSSGAAADALRYLQGIVKERDELKAAANGQGELGLSNDDAQRASDDALAAMRAERDVWATLLTATCLTASRRAKVDLPDVGSFVVSLIADGMALAENSGSFAECDGYDMPTKGKAVVVVKRKLRIKVTP